MTCKSTHLTTEVPFHPPHKIRSIDYICPRCLYAASHRGLTFFLHFFKISVHLNIFYSLSGVFYGK
jgi:hypothetical protein